MNLATLYDVTFTKSRVEKLDYKLTVAAIIGFILHIILIALGRLLEGSHPLISSIPRNFIYAIYTPFSILLFYEVLQLVLALPGSFSRTVGKLFEIFSLILIRSVFKDLAEFEDLSDWATDIPHSKAVLFDMLGSIGMFMGTAVFYYLNPSTSIDVKASKIKRFINLKKSIAILLCITLFSLTGAALVEWFGELYLVTKNVGAVTLDLDLYFFPQFFEIMIYFDIIILLASFLIYEQYEILFRNAGYVICAILLRMSLSSPSPYNVGLALLSVSFAIVLTGILRYLGPAFRNADRVIDH